MQRLYELFSLVVDSVNFREKEETVLFSVKKVQTTRCLYFQTIIKSNQDNPKLQS